MGDRECCSEIQPTQGNDRGHVSTATAERSFSVMSVVGIDSYSCPQDKTLNEERIIYQFNRLALTFHPNEGEGSK